MQFEWCADQAKKNFMEYGVSFDEALTCFYDPHQIAFEDPDNADNFSELLLGNSKQERLLLLKYISTNNTENIKLLSARLATKDEVSYYKENKIKN